MSFLDDIDQEISSWINEEEWNDLWSPSPYVFPTFTDNPPSVQGINSHTRPSRTPSQEGSLSSESSNSARPYALPLDEYYDFESDTSDEEMEEATTDDPFTATTATTLDPRPEPVRCLWQGCFAEFMVGTHHEVWKDHIRLVHVERRDERGKRLPRATKCQWDGCGKKFRQSQGVVKHMATHLHDIRRPCPLGCGKKFRAEQFTITRHLRHCSLRGTTATRG